MAATVSTMLTGLLEAVDEQLLHPDAGEFVGREFVRDEIQQFLAAHNRLLVLVAPPGVGKTALAAQLLREHLDCERPYLAHFCGLSGADNPFAFCSALAKQLRDQLGEGYSLPQTVRNQQVTIQANVSVGQAASDTSITGVTLNVGGMHPREAFRQLVREPLRAYNEQHGAERGDAPLIIVIDGLDRAWDWDGGQDGNIVSVLADAQDLPVWVNLICTARPGPAVQALRAQAGVRVVNLQGDANLKDIETFVHERFLAALPAEARDKLAPLLTQAHLAPASASADQDDAFVQQVVAASQGSFLFVRRYVDAWRTALMPGAAQPSVDPAALLRFESGTLAATLDTTYAATLAELRRNISRSPDAADEDVLGALAVGFAPLTLALLAAITGRPASAIEQALEQRLKPVLEQRGSDADPTYAFYHRGFAEYLRQQLPQQGRGWDVRAATALEQDNSDDAQLREYSARYRWSHLLRGLDLAAAAREGSREPAAAPATGDQPAAPSSLNSIAEVQAQVRNPLLQAQLLRGLAARALDPQQSDATGSWSAALSCLRTAEHALRRSRALAYTRQRTWRAEQGGPISNELIELEHTLVALGDAYSTIARRMDGSGQRPLSPDGVFGRLHALWDAIARFPVTLYLLLVLLVQSVSEIHIPGALQNLGRAQDWTVARLYVLGVSAYRRARSLARARGDDDSADEVAERLANLYSQMCAYDAAAAAYETLLARPSAAARVWRQAIWRLALGEVLVAQRRPDQAIEVLTSALPTFVSQQAPVQQARVLSALGAAYDLRARAASARGDGRTASMLDDQAIESCRAALLAWQNVTTLQGDESASVDPALAISNIAHQLWRATHNQRLGDEQQHSARTLLDSITERHFPQRFEHPVLRLFRIIAAVLLPAYLLAGLLAAVQLPSTVQVRTQTGLAFAAPLLDVTQYPNELVTGRISSITAASASTFSVLSLTQLAHSQVKLQPSPPQLDPLGTVRIVLIIMAIYLICYTAFGLAVIIFSSPAQFQGRRPGRLILRKDSLLWRGPAGQGSLLDALEWIKQDARSLAQRLWRRLGNLIGRAGGESSGPPPREIVLALTDIERAVAVDRRAFGFLMTDFSSTLLEARGSARRSVLIPGTIVHYNELCDELELRMHRPRRPFGVEIIRSWWGICFLLTLCYTLALVILLPLLPAPLNTPLPWLGYSLISLYVLAAPGLLLPLMWWFIAQPLGANSTRPWAALPFAAVTLVGAALTVAVLVAKISLTPLGLRPDLTMPLLATGFLAALVCYAPPRPLRRMFVLKVGPLLRTLLALAALVGVVLLSVHIFTTLRWYDALVRGNRLVAQALAPTGCGTECDLIDQAIKQYDEVICLQPDDSDGYAFRGFAYLARQSYQQARDDFERALGEESPSDACAQGLRPTPSARQRASLYTNIGAVEMLLASRPPLANAERHYQSALQSYARALLDGEPPGELSCATLARHLLQPTVLVDPVLGVDPLSPSVGTLRRDQAPVVLQLADVCYSSGSTKVDALVTNMTTQARGIEREGLRLSAWQDLTAAVAEYRAVAAAASDSYDRQLARHALAAAWLALSQLDRPPVGALDRHTALLQALNAYQDLELSGLHEPNVYIGQAWSSIQLGAWDSAKAPLGMASALAPGDTTYPALQGLAAWLDSTLYPAPRKGQPSPGYTTAISEALGYYSHVIELGTADMPRAYVTRSLLYFSLRNSPRGPSTQVDAAPDAPYNDEDYGVHMRAAIADASQALLAAEHAQEPPERQVGYHYWRGRLSLTLALTWQEKTHGPHSWAELASIYSSAYQDFTSAAARDLNPARRQLFRDSWIPWTTALLSNATHLQFAEEAVGRRDFARARSELALVDPQPTSFRRWDQLSAPLPDYHFLHGLISLGLGMPKDFVNPLLTNTSGALADYDEGIKVTENPDLVPQPHTDYPDDSRPAVYRTALEDLDALIKRPPEDWPAQARAAAQQARAKLQQQLDALAK